MKLAEYDPPYDERVDILDKLATMADRSVKPDAIRFQIQQLSDFIVSRLSTGSPQTFETVGMGLKRCGTCLPYKAPIYATLAALLSLRDHPFADDIANKLAEAVGKDLAVAIRDGRASVARRALRYLACLGCSLMVSPLSVAEYISVLLDAALYEMTGANRSEYGVHCRGEFLADIAFSALPWAAPVLSKRVPDGLSKIVDTVRQIEEAWSSGRWRCVAPSTDQRCIECFAELLEATFLLKDSGWECPESVIPRPYREFEEQLKEGKQVKLETLTIPGHSKLTRYSAPRFRLYLVNPKPDPSKRGMMGKMVSEKGTTKMDGSNVKPIILSVKGEKPAKKEKPDGLGEKMNEDLSFGNEKEGDSTNSAEKGEDSSANANDVEMSDISKDTKRTNGVTADPTLLKPPPTYNAGADRPLVERFVLRSYIADIVDNFSTNHVMAAERLLTIPMLHKVDDEIVEGLFSQLCAMPEPTFAPVYYGTLFVDLCRVKDSRLPIKLLTAVEAMFQEAGLFDPESFDRLTEWFSFHLSNFEYKWNWSDWAVYADADMVDKFPFRALFCKDVLARCIRLSYYERVLDVVPEEMKFFLPPKPNNGNRSRFDEVVNENLMKVVTGKDKQEAKVVKERLSAMILVNGRVDDPEEQKKANMSRLSALIRSILQAGCKTLSHFDTVCERYLSLLLEMTEIGGVPAKRLITLEVSCFWDAVHIRKMYVLDRLSMHRVIDGMAIIDSVLSENRAEGNSVVPLTDGELKANLADSNCWEMVRLVMQRARARLNGARIELTSASQAAATANEGEQDKAELRLEAAKTGTERAKTEISELLLLSFRKLFAMCDRLLGENAAEDDELEKSEYNRNLPGFDDKPVWYWRCLGMIRELARKHPQHLTSTVEKLEDETGEARERHQELWDSFEIIREVEGCAMLSQVW